MTNGLYDAHNHLQDTRFGGRQAELLATCQQEGVAAMVVNGSGEADWPQVLALAQTHDPLVIPSFGYHPWYVGERTPDWERGLVALLDQVPSGVGEVGLDRWKPGLSYDGQEAVFVAQLRIAAGRNLPLSIHCLRAWGRLLALLREEPLPARGFLLHSYGGSAEMVLPLARLGAYFSLPGYYAHARKVRQRETFRRVPRDRLLIETDAPDQALPEERTLHGLHDAESGKPINHPANLKAVYQFAAELLGEPPEVLTARVAENFARFFRGLC